MGPNGPSRAGAGGRAAPLYRLLEVGHGHMQQYSGRLRVIAYFCAMFKDFYRNWTIGTARKRRRRRREERGEIRGILVQGFPWRALYDRKNTFLLSGGPSSKCALAIILIILHSKVNSKVS